MTLDKDEIMIFSPSSTDIVIAPEPSEIEKQKDEDYETARNNIKDIVELGQKAFQSLIELADQSQNTTAYEVISKTIKELVIANKELAELSRKKAQLDKFDKPYSEAGGETKVTNNLYVGTTKDLAQVLKDMKNLPE